MGHKACFCFNLFLRDFPCLKQVESHCNHLSEKSESLDKSLECIWVFCLLNSPCWILMLLSGVQREAFVLTSYIGSLLHPLSWTCLSFISEAPEVGLSSCDSTQKTSFASCWEQFVGIKVNETRRPQIVLCVLGWNDVWKGLRFCRNTWCSVSPGYQR